MMSTELPQDNKLYVQKRDGRFQAVCFDKIVQRVEMLSSELEVSAMLGAFSRAKTQRGGD